MISQLRKGWGIRAVLLTLVIGFFLSGAAAYFEQRLEHQRNATEFMREADNQFAAFKRQLEVDLAILRPAGAFLKSSQSVTRKEFQTFGQAAIDSDNTILALGWVPRVSYPKRSLFEEKARAEGLADFSFKELQNGHLVPAGTRDEYFPLYYISPQKGDNYKLGFDFATNPQLQAMLMKARDTGKIMASEPSFSMGGSSQENRYSFLVATPMYMGLPTTVSQRKETLHCFVVVFFEMTEIIEKALTQIDTGEFHIVMHVFDGDQILYPALEEHAVQEPFEADMMASGYHVEKTIEIGGRKLLVQLLPASDCWNKYHYSRSSLIIFVVGNLLTLLIALNYRNAGMRTAEIERQVAKRSKQLRASEDRAEAIISKAVIPIITINDVCLIQSFNPAAERLFGYEGDEVLGENVKILMPEPHQSQHDGYVGNFLETGKRKMIGIGREVTGLRKDGTTFPMHLSVSGTALLDEVLFIGMIVDLTNLKEAEAKLRDHRDNLSIVVDARTQELKVAMKHAEAANVAKSAFLANMSHEIRTPMNSVLGFVKIALESPDLPGELKIHLETAHNSAQNLLDLINDILDLSKLESKKLTLQTGCLDLPNTVNRSLKTLQSLARSKGLELKFDYDVDLPLCFEGDSGRLRQILVNLVGNAIKFTESGTITVTVKAADNGGDLLHFTVEDQGIGMTPEQAAQIFKPFTQANSSTARIYGGTGLGLAIVKQCVELMHGRVWVESEPGKGSQFHFTAKLPPTPCTPDCLSEEERGVPELVSPRLFHILLAEDILENVTLAKFRLEQQGHTVDHAWNGREAVEMYRQGGGDLILMDVMMPEMDGIQATRAIREIETGSDAHIPIIALTASVMKEDKDSFKDAGMDAVCGKPIILDELFRTMEEVVPQGVGRENEAAPGDLALEVKVDLSPVSHVVDVQAALDLWQDSLIFAESLQSFVEKHSDDTGKIRQLLDDGKSEDAHALSHTIKGAAGNLSMTGIVPLATKIDDAIKAGNYDQAIDLLPNLNEALASATLAVSQLELPKLSDTAPVKEFDAAVVSSLLQELLLLLDEDNPSVVEPVCGKLGEYLSKEELAVVGQAIDNFDFEQAKAETVILAEKLGVKMEAGG